MEQVKEVGSQLNNQDDGYRSKVETRKEIEKDLDDIKETYVNLCSQLGNSHYQRAIHGESIEELIKRLKEVNQKAAEINMKLKDKK